MNERKLAVACGGTGGHFYPGLSIARTFLHENPADHRALLFLSGRHVEAQTVAAANHGIDSVRVPAAERPASILEAGAFADGLLRGFFTANGALARFRPDAFLAMGSFASVPNVLAARWRRIPVFLHDGNARIGRANLTLSRFARHLGTAFPPVNGDRSKCPCTWTGMPIRPELLAASRGHEENPLDAANRKFGSSLKPETPTLLVFGGSQGARTLNVSLPALLCTSGLDGFQVIHLSGKGNLESVCAAYASARFPHLVLEGTESMDLLYRAADLVICRSGGSTIAELALFGKYAALAPYPYAADLHQNDNAEFYISSGAGERLEDAAFTPSKISEILNRWLKHPEEIAALGKKGLELARPDASQALLTRIFPSEIGPGERT